MRKTFLPGLLLLGGCASAQMEPVAEGPRPGGIIRRVDGVAAVDTTIQAVRLAETAGTQPARLVDAPCQTGDPMPVAQYRADDLPRMPSARAGALPYIPNVCPVIAAPGLKSATPAVLHRTPKRVRPGGEQP